MAICLDGTITNAPAGRRILEEIADLNEDFIRLLAQLANTAGATTLGIPPEQVEHITALHRTARKRLTHSAVTLFALRFHDAAFWTKLLDQQHPDCYREPRCADPQQQLELQLFTLSALMHLRHIARINRFIAAVCYCVADDFIDRFQSVTVSRLKHIAADYGGLLHSRPEINNTSWPQLISLARRIDGQQLMPARLLSFQFSGRT